MVLFTHTDWLPWKWWKTNLVSAHSQMLLLVCAYWLVRKGLAINHLQTAENEKTRTKSFLNLRLFLGLYTEINLRRCFIEHVVHWWLADPPFRRTKHFTEPRNVTWFSFRDITRALQQHEDWLVIWMPSVTPNWEKKSDAWKSVGVSVVPNYQSLYSKEHPANAKIILFLHLNKSYLYRRDWS